MDWIVAAVTIITLITLSFSLWRRPEAENDWRDGAEGLRQRLERAPRHR